MKPLSNVYCFYLIEIHCGWAENVHNCASSFRCHQITCYHFSNRIHSALFGTCQSQKRNVCKKDACSGSSVEATLWYVSFFITAWCDCIPTNWIVCHDDLDNIRSTPCAFRILAQRHNPQPHATNNNNCRF